MHPTCHCEEQSDEATFPARQSTDVLEFAKRRRLLRLLSRTEGVLVSADEACTQPVIARSRATKQPSQRGKARTFLNLQSGEGCFAYSRGRRGCWLPRMKHAPNLSLRGAERRSNLPSAAKH